MIARRAKIVCTIGPAVETREAIRGLIEAGMDVARLNFSHGKHAEHGARLDLVRAESLALGKPVAILQDLCGPKIRTGLIGPAALESGGTIDLVGGKDGDDHTIAIDYEGLAHDVRPDDRILLSDGQVELRLDQAWRTSMPSRDRRAVTALAAPLLLGYGYLRTGGGDA